VQQVEQEKKATIIKGNGEAEAARLIGEAVKEYGNGFVELRKIEAAKEIAESLSKSRNIIFVPSGVGMLMNMPGIGGGNQNQNQNQSDK
jgi:prohibitin 1